MTSRRWFVRSCALGMVGATFGARGRTVVVVFQRGGADGLNIVVPHGEEAYYALRPTIAIPRPGSGDGAALDLDGFFGLHPALGPLMPLYERGHLAAVHAVGWPWATRSHLDAQQYVDGWMERACSGEACGDFTGRMREIAGDIRRGKSGRTVFADLGGWDHHVDQAGALGSALREYAEGMRGFWDQMGERMDDVVVVTVSEFGRAARENGTRGTDHGRAGCMLVMGGGVKGGKVYGRWPGLRKDQLHEGRDLAATGDWRDALEKLTTRR